MGEPWDAGGRAAGSEDRLRDWRQKIKARGLGHVLARHPRATVEGVGLASLGALSPGHRGQPLCPSGGFGAGSAPAGGSSLGLEGAGEE